MPVVKQIQQTFTNDVRAAKCGLNRGRKNLKSMRLRNRLFPFFDGIITIHSGRQLQPLH